MIETTVPIVEFIPPFKMDNDKYIITLPDFEGPLDLLLFFIKRDELNIYDIPISKITEEFLVYTQELKILDLEDLENL